jgi:hypothetical protein
LESKKTNQKSKCAHKTKMYRNGQRGRKNKKREREGNKEREKRVRERERK